MAAQVNIVDLKEPHHGALAPSSVELWRRTARLWSSHLDGLGETVPLLSAALGEASEACQLARYLPSPFNFAKAGPRGCSTVREIRVLWSKLRDQLDDRIELVAVAYADFLQADCPPPHTVFQAASDAGLRRCLIDTCRKDGRSTLDHMRVDGLARLDEIARTENLWWALAGSLHAVDAATILHQGVVPDCFGVRGDICAGDRTGTLSRNRVQAWKDVLVTSRPNPGPSCS